MLRRLIQASGVVLLAATIPVTLPAHGQTAFAMPDRFVATAGKRGVAQFSTASINLTGLGLRFSSNGSFTSVDFLRPPAQTDRPKRSRGP